MLEPFIESLWVSDEEVLKRVVESPVRQEDRKICLTKCPEYANILARSGNPCIYMEKQGCDTHVFGVDLIFQEEGEGEPDPELLKKVWQRHFHIPWLIGQTKRLWIRESVIEDLPAFIRMYEEEAGNPDVNPMTEEPQEELEAYIAHRYPFYGYGLWSIVEKASGQVIGRAGFQEYELLTEETRTEVAYLIAKKYRRKGYAKEAVQAILAYGEEELELEEVDLRTSETNRASQSLAENLGFKKINNTLYRRIKV